MGRHKKDPTPTIEMKQRAAEWRRFRTDNLLSQKRLSEVIEISRRTIQNIEAAQECSPHQRVLDAFAALQARYEREGKKTGRRKTKKNHHEEGEF
jgi:DNA-binding XRE family transcriptional regulator